MMKIRKFGFTLSEVLITLAIIGVVAGITVPMLNSSTKNEQFKAGAYKNLSVLNNAVRRCYSFDHKRINEFQDSNDLKTNFFYNHFNVMHLGQDEQPNWPENVHVETTIYLNDGAKYGISDKITDSCEYNINNKEENIPCFFIYVDTNGDKKPNKITQSKDLYQDINTVYAYADRFILQPGEIEYSDDEGNIPDPPETPEAPDTPESPDTPDTPDTPEPPAEEEEDDDNNNDHKMERCLEKKSYEECVSFCEKNGYHSALCR